MARKKPPARVAAPTRCECCGVPLDLLPVEQTLCALCLVGGCQPGGAAVPCPRKGLPKPPRPRSPEAEAKMFARTMKANEPHHRMMESMAQGYHLMAAFLECAVPLAIADLQRRGGPGASDWAAARVAGAEFASHTSLMYHDKRTAELAGKLARTVAVMAFCPGGIDLMELHFEATAPGDTANEAIAPRARDQR